VPGIVCPLQQPSLEALNAGLNGERAIRYWPCGGQAVATGSPRGPSGVAGEVGPAVTVDPESIPNREPEQTSPVSSDKCGNDHTIQE
jgi:hypothetical protein